MGYVRLGRKLGVGVRVASWMLRERATQSAPQTAQQVAQQAARIAIRASSAESGSIPRTAAGVRRGTRRFGERLWGPFAYAGGVVWLEVTGCFFAFFGLYFAQGAWRLRAAWRTGPDHEKMLFCLIAAVVFFYFAINSFYRARKKERQYRAKHD